MISFVRHYIYTDKQQIDELGKQIKEPRERYTKANANYDFIGYRQHTDEELEQAKREYEESKAEYTYFSQKLEYLYKLQEERRKEVAKYTNIHVSGIHAIGTATKVLIAKYQRQNKHYEQQQRTHPKEAADISQEYFSMTLIGQIYDKCVEIQFEQISAPDFHANVNLYPCKNRLKIKTREKIRVCYLIFLMSEKLSKQYKDEWRNKILELLDIDESYYKSKYKEPVSDFPSDSNQIFAKEMESIFR